MSDTVSSLKSALRKTALADRCNIPDKPRKSELIAARVFADPDYIAAGTVALYCSLKSEVDTAALIAHALSCGKTVALPKVYGDTMRFFAVSSGEVLVKSPFGVLEPAGDESRFVPPESFDLVLVPGVCFDRGGNRLGFGRGYYDRFLSVTRAKTAALCFELQLVAEGVIPTDRYDVKISKIITENETI
ncbi:MAG: 5-formyltetrahydrofolate cyclo-ligase [Clostridia bacterium]|nr:5-formyltetrahydrofolate cyclo-ligase [Clostridia bacterium]